jgi:ABC-type Mn2+/Zn2+ transport system permease subunit
MEPVLVSFGVGLLVGGIGCFYIANKIHTVANTAAASVVSAVTAATTIKTPIPAVNADVSQLGANIVAAINKASNVAAAPKV